MRHRATDQAAADRLDRIIREIAAHFGTMAPAIIAVSKHVIANEDRVVMPADPNVCDCTTPRPLLSTLPPAQPAKRQDDDVDISDIF